MIELQGEHAGNLLVVLDNEHPRCAFIGEWHPDEATGRPIASRPLSSNLHLGVTGVSSAAPTVRQCSCPLTTKEDPMELNLNLRRLLLVLAAAGAVLAIGLSTAASFAGAKPATKHHRTVAHRTHHNRNATRNAVNQTTPASEGGESTAPETDGPGGPDAGGDHQCPPACSPGEQP
jgi:hypothetical protein